MAARLQDAAREPRHGRRRVDRPLRHRPSALGHPRQGRGLAALSSARRRLATDPRLRGRRLARLPGPREARGRGTRAGRPGLPRAEAPRGRHARARPGARRRRAARPWRRARGPHRRQHGLHGRRRAPRDARPRGARRRVARGAVPRPRPPELRPRRRLREGAARGGRKPLHALRVHAPHRGPRDHDPPARPLEDGRPDRGPPRRGARLRVEALDPPPHVDDRPQHGGHDPLPGRHRQRRLLRGGRLEGQPLPRPAHERAYTLDTNGCVAPLEKPGLGVEVDEDFLVKHPVIEGPAYV